MRPSILLPWNLGSYQAMNGFHPLFREWLALQQGVDLLRLPWGHEISGLLAMDGVQQPADASERGLEPLFEYDVFRRFYSIYEYRLASRVAATAEFHHTVPFTSGRRPFFFHCEAIAPMLMPFLYQGRPLSDPRIEVALEVLRTLLESDCCLAIYSHVQQTLQEFRDTFASATIDRKLQFLPLAITGREAVAADKQETLTFLFTNSAHQEPQNFALRGGILALQIFDRVRREVRGARLIIVGRNARQFFEMTLSAAADPGESPAGGGFRAMFERNRDHIVWVEGWQTEASIDRLYRSANFLLLPSVDLHSSSLLRAMRNGCIPIVSNAYGVSEIVEHGRTGLIIDMLDDEISGVRKFGFSNSDHASFFSRGEAIAAVVAGECDRFLPVIIDPAARRDLRERMGAATARRFGHLNLYTRFHDLLRSHGIARSSGDLDGLTVPLDPVADFGPVRPRRIAKWGSIGVYRHGTGVISVPTEQLRRAASLEALSPSEPSMARYGASTADALHHLLRSRPWRSETAQIDFMPMVKPEAGVVRGTTWRVLVGADFTLLPPAFAEPPIEIVALRLRLVCCERSVGARFDVGLRCATSEDRLETAAGGRLNSGLQVTAERPIPAGGWAMLLRAEELGPVLFGEVAGVAADGEEWACDFAPLDGLKQGSSFVIQAAGAPGPALVGGWLSLEAGLYVLEWCAFADGDGGGDGGEPVLLFELVCAAGGAFRKEACRRDLGDTHYTPCGIDEKQAHRPLEFRVSHYGRDVIGLVSARLHRVE